MANDILPKWISKIGEGEYLGVSAPCQDIEAARTHAICNAILNYMFVNGKGTFTTLPDYEESFLSNTNTGATISKRMYIKDNVIFDNFTPIIKKSFFNNRGEYFVKCAFLDNDNAEDNKIIIHRNSNLFATNEEVPRWSICLDVTLRINNEESRLALLQHSEDGKVTLGIKTKGVLSFYKDNKALDYPKSSLRKKASKISTTIDLDKYYTLGVAQTMIYSSMPTFQKQITVT